MLKRDPWSLTKTNKLLKKTTKPKDKESGHSLSPSFYRIPLMKTLTLLFLPLVLAGCACPFKKSQTKAYPQNQPIQQITDRAVDSAMQSLHPKRIMVIVAEPKTGRILAMTGKKEGSNKLTDDPISRFYGPGSTFKPVVAVATLQEGKITPKTEINCEQGAFPFGGKVIKDHQKYGNLTYDQILMKSSNIGAVKMALLLKDAVYFDYVRLFGFGEKTGIAILGEVQGIVNPPSSWDGLTKARMAFGQSVAVTPIQLTMAYCAIANGGKLMKPVIGSEKTTVVRRACSKKTADLVKNALAKVASDQGTAPLAQVKGVTVGGKTGTSQAITPDGHYATDKYVTSFAGFFPVEKPRYVCVVVVDQADLKPEVNYGGLVAAPIFSDIAKKILALGR